MKGIFYKIFGNIAKIFQWRNLWWHLLFISLTYVLVNSGFDWSYYMSTRGILVQSVFWPAVILGFFLPLCSPLIMIFYGKITKNKRLENASYSIAQAGILGLLISSSYKVFTGRVGPHLRGALANVDISHMFRLGFYRGGAFQGWPSSHTTVAFAMSFALITLYPKDKLLKYIAFIYALYIGVGVSVNIHWFSDFVAGAILGAVIGITVGKCFLEKYSKINIVTS